MFGPVGLAVKGVKSVAAGRTQANLGIQSPHLPNAVVRIGRFGYVFSAVWIGGTWYSAYVNMRTTPGSGPKVVLPGQKPKAGASPSRQDKVPRFAQQLQPSGSSAAPGGPQGALSRALPGGGMAGGFLPRGANYKPGRADQGRDGQTNAGGAIIAPGAGLVLRVGTDPSGFGPAYPIVKFSSGPYAGRIMYIGHTISALSAGVHFSPNQILSRTGQTPIGNASVPGWFEIGYADSGSPGPFGQATPF